VSLSRASFSKAMKSMLGSGPCGEANGSDEEGEFADLDERGLEVLGCNKLRPFTDVRSCSKRLLQTVIKWH